MTVNSEASKSGDLHSGLSIGEGLRHHLEDCLELYAFVFILAGAVVVLYWGWTWLLVIPILVLIGKAVADTWSTSRQQSQWRQSASNADRTITIAQSKILLGQKEVAEELLVAAAAEARSAQHPGLVSEALVMLGELRYDRGDLSGALNVFLVAQEFENQCASQGRALGARIAERVRQLSPVP